MYPELFTIGNLTIHSYGLMISLAVLVAVMAVYREAPRENINPDHVLEAVIVAALTGLIGARLLYMLLNWDYYSGRFISSFFVQFEGLSFYGAFFGGTLALFFWSYYRKIGFLKMADLLAPYLALGYAIGRVGCFLNGCCYGKESTVPWALPIRIGDPVLRHPVQLYAIVLAVIIFIILKRIRPRRPFVGFQFIFLFTLYGTLRFTTEFFRFGEIGLLGLTLAQWFSLGLIVVSLSAIALFNYFQPKGKEPKKSKKKRKAAQK
ncbi:MAG: prolipoprotein diacylglyceryl transferase [Bacillota bacterium]